MHVPSYMILARYEFMIYDQQVVDSPHPANLISGLINSTTEDEPGLVSAFCPTHNYNCEPLICSDSCSISDVVLSVA